MARTRSHVALNGTALGTQRYEPYSGAIRHGPVNVATEVRVLKQVQTPIDRVLDVVGLAFLVFVYFHVYWHYWLVALLGGYVINTLVPVGGLAAVAAVRASRRVVDIQHKIRPSGLRFPFMALALYVVIACISVILHERTADDLRATLIYVLSPPMVFLGTYATFRGVPREVFKRTFRLLVACGVALSLYVVTIYVSQDPARVAQLAALETNRGTVTGDTGAWYGIGDSTPIMRFTIPGLNSTMYGPMLAPLIAIALSLIGPSPWRIRGLYLLAAALLGYCALMTVSRGAILAIVAAFAYLVWSKQLPKPLTWLSLSALIVAAATFAQLTFMRLSLSIGLLFPSANSWLVPEWARWMAPDDQRLLSIPDTLSVIAEHPLLGVGMSRLIEIQDITFGKEHNNYLAVAAAFGVMALVCYATFIASFVVRIARATQRAGAGSPEHTLLAISGAGTVALATYLHAAPAEFHFIWAWFGLTAAVLTPCASGQSAPIRHAPRDVMARRCSAVAAAHP